MASSWTDCLVMRRDADDGLVLTLEREGADAIAEEDWDAVTWAELKYYEPVQGPQWLVEFIEAPDGRVADRVSLPDAEELLRLVATIDPNLAEDTQRLLNVRRGDSDEQGDT